MNYPNNNNTNTNTQVIEKHPARLNGEANKKIRPKRLRQSQPLRIERSDYSWLSTSRCLASKLWLVNNKPLHEAMLGQLAKYQTKYEIVLYGFVIMGNHTHMLAQYPKLNRAGFKRDLNARFAELIKEFNPRHEKGPVFERRYSAEALPAAEDLEDRFFYCALQAINAGLCENIHEYPAYNSFEDAINGREREFKIVRWAEYNSKKRFNPKLKKEDFTDTYVLRYARLPGYEHLSQEEYANLMREKLEKRRKNIVNAFKAKKHRYPSLKELNSITPGSKPYKTKTSTRHSKRPLVLSVCPIRREEYLSWYFSIYTRYKAACALYLAGDRNAVFPPGTYKPPGPLVLN